MFSRKVFISYSHKDEVWKDRLVSHLGVLEEQGLLEAWDDRRIKAGGDWQAEIGAAMERADVAVLLVSANSLTSKFILKEEVRRLLDRKAAEGIRIYPVIVKACTWQRVPWLAKMQVRPRDGRPLASFEGNKRDEQLAKIADEVLTLLSAEPSPEELLRPESTTLNQPQKRQTAATPALHQLPLPPADFTGREEELAELHAAMRETGARVVLIRGTGGVGKTALALTLAQELAPLYPDAQLYLDLKGASKQPLSAAQAMAHVIRAYQPLAQLPENDAELAGLYRSVLHGQRALLLMDNAASSPDRVEALVPPAGCLLLFTSRFYFNLPGLFAKDLDELPEEDAQALLRRIAPRVGEQALPITRLCGHLPIALRFAGGALAEQPWLPSAEYTRRLMEAQSRLGLIQGTLTASYELLSEELQSLWRKLAVFPGTFDAAAAAAVWELELRRPEEALGELVRSSLVQWEEEGEGELGRYHLHDLARVFADARLSPDERETTWRRHAAHYQHVLSTAEDLYLGGGETLLRGLRLFDREWGNIQAGQAWAAARSTEDREADELCSAYPSAGAYCLALRLHPRSRTVWLEAALAAARRRNDRVAEGRHLGDLGNAYADLGETHRAIEHHEKHLVIAREVADRRGEGQAIGNLGALYATLGEIGRAIEHFEQWLIIVREIGDCRGEGRALANLGNAYKNLAQRQRAIEYQEQSLAIFREIGDRHGEGTALGNLANAYGELGETRRAIEYQEQSLAIAREIGDRKGEGRALGNLGAAYAALEETRRAIEHYEQYLVLAREIGDRRGEVFASWKLGIGLEQEGELGRAADLLQVCVDYERSIGHPDAEEDAAHLAALRARIAAGGLGTVNG